MKRLIILLIVLSAKFTEIFAGSVPNYSLIKEQKPLHELTENRTLIFDKNVEPNISVPIQLPANFIFDDLPYGHVRIHPSGWVSLSEEEAITEGNNLTQLNRPVLSPLWDDFELSLNSGLEYQVSYETVTTSQGDMFIVEWKNMVWRTGIVQGDPLSTVTFQLILHTSNNKVEFIYAFTNELTFYYDPTSGVNEENQGASIGIGGKSLGSENLFSFLESNMPTSTVQLPSDILNGYSLLFTPGTLETDLNFMVGQETGTLFPSEISKKVLRMNVQTPLNRNGSPINSIVVKLTGTSNLFDLDKVIIYRTGSVASFSTANLISQQIVSSTSNTYQFVLSNQSLATGDNYFWLAVDINEHCIEGNKVDAEILSVEVSSSTHLLSVGNPQGSLLLLRQNDAAGRGLASPLPINNLDYAKNWTEVLLYDENGQIRSQTRTYQDFLGRVTQTQNLVTDNVLASQVVYDAFGRPALSSLTAPIIGQSEIIYKSNLLTNNVGTAYSYNDFDLSIGNSSTNTLSNPKPVGKQQGSIGYYYSNNNSNEPFVAASSFPYSRTVYSNDPSAIPFQSSMAGEKHKMGSGHESYTFKMLSSGELSYVYGYMRSYVKNITRNVDEVLDNSVGEVIQLNKSIQINQDGATSIAFTNNSGTLIATCLTGQGEICTSQKVSAEIAYSASKFGAPLDYSDAIDIHLPLSKKSTLIFEGVFDNDVYMDGIEFILIDLRRNKQLILNIDYSISIDPSNPLLKRKIVFNSPNNSSDLILRLAYTWTKPTNCNTCKLSYVRVNYELDYSHWNMNYFDPKGNLLTTVQPKAVNCTYNPLASAKIDVSREFVPLLGTAFAQIPLRVEPGLDRVLRIKIAPIVKPELSPYFFRAIERQIESINVASNRELRNEPMQDGGDPPLTNVSGRYVYFNFKLDIVGHNNNCNHGSTNICNNKINTAPLSLGFALTIAETSAGTYTYTIENSNSLTFTIDNYKLSNYSSYALQINSAQYKVGYENSPTPPSFVPYLYADAMSGNTGYYHRSSTGDLLYYHQIVKFEVNHEERSFTSYNGLADDLFTSHFKYDDEQRLIELISPDEGITQRLYDAENKLRFSQNSLQRLSGKFSYVNYDVSDRVIETGEYDPSLPGNVELAPNLFYFFETANEYNGNNYADRISVIAILNHIGNFDPMRCTNQNYTAYDKMDVNFPISLSSTYAKSNSQLRVSKTWNNVSTTWYGYDFAGRMIWTVQALSQLGVKTIDYEYDPFYGSLTKMLYQKGSNAEKFVHIYDYDAYRRLRSVSTLQGQSNVPIQHAKYHYYLHGPLKRVELGQATQGIDYVYTINGWLKGINSASLDPTRDPGRDNSSGTNSAFAKDVFGMELDYFNGDYERANTLVQSMVVASPSLGMVDKYNGAIKAQRWNTILPSFANNAYANYGQLMYGYTYDKQQMLVAATFGTASVGGNNGNGNSGADQEFTERAEYKLDNISYDLNGNITSLQRSGNIASNGYLMDDLQYSYNNNQLKQVTDAVNSATYTDDFDHQSETDNYVYNEIGQITEDRAKNLQFEYNHLALISKIYDLSSSELKTEYIYNEKGQKLKKIQYGVSQSHASRRNLVSYYINDAAGQVLAIYEGLVEQNQVSGVWVTQTTTEIDFSVKEYTIIGQGRIGIQQMATNGSMLKSLYEMKDHLGNVRAVVSSVKVNGQAEVMSYTDYYPHGSVLPGRNAIANPDYRYSYQGQESESSQQLVEFDLRMYDANLGRWLSPDPFSEFHSPYLAMGNDPVNRIDPTGGKTDRGENVPRDDGYEGPGRRPDPFDFVGAMVGGGNADLPGLSAMFSNNSDYDEFMAFSSWAGNFESDLTMIYQALQKQAQVKRKNDEDKNGPPAIKITMPGANGEFNGTEYMPGVSGADVTATNDGDYLQYEAKFVNETRTQGTLVWYNSSGEVIAEYPAVSGSGNPKYYTIPEGTWEASYLNQEYHEKYARAGVSFRVTLGPDRFDPSRGRKTGLIRIHPARSMGTEGCIGLIGSKTNILDFYSRYKNYYKAHGSMPVKVIYLRP